MSEQAVDLFGSINRTHKELQALKIKLEAVLAFSAIPSTQQAEALAEAKVQLGKVDKLLDVLKCV